MSSESDAIYAVFSNELSYLRPYVMEVFSEAQRPSVLFRPTIRPDGNQWCALYGEDLHDGVAGFGDTPEEAMRDFDKNWREETRPASRLTKFPDDPAACPGCGAKKDAAGEREHEAGCWWFEQKFRAGQSWTCKHGSEHAAPIAVALCGCERPCAGCNGTGKAMARVQYVDRACAMEERPCPLCQ